jgi:hypothetical protein
VAQSDAGVVQLPSPSHQLAGDCLLPAQDWALQAVPPAHFLQAAFPLHEPSNPQLACASAGHWFLGSVPSKAAVQLPVPLQTLQRGHSDAGSVALATKVHVPTDPASLHDLHAPSHLTLQHTPSVQNPEMHCAPVAQGWPLAPLGLQTPPSQ